jgi:hypothetical protein
VALCGSDDDDSTAMHSGSRVRHLPAASRRMSNYAADVLRQLHGKTRAPSVLVRGPRARPADIPLKDRKEDPILKEAYERERRMQAVTGPLALKGRQDLAWLALKRRAKQQQLLAMQHQQLPRRCVRR